MSNVLKGIRVLDLTNVLAGPYSCYLLAQLGAEVIKVERADSGDLARQLGADSELNQKKMGVSFLAQNAGKMSMTLNLKDPVGKEIFKKLVKNSDVVVENFRAGVMKRLELDYDSLKEINPKLIYCSISGFGQDGPMAPLQAYDQIVQGLSGVMSVTGDEETGPLRVGYPLCDTIGGLTASFAISAALYRRSQTNQGENIDVSMLESTLSTMGWVVSNWLIAGVAPTRLGNQNMTAAPSGAFKTKDGLLNIAANQQKQFERLSKIVGRETWLSDPKFNDREARKVNREELNKELENALSKKTAKEWAALLNQNDVPAGEVQSIPDVLAHPQVEARDFIQKISNDQGHEINVVRAGFKLGSGDPKLNSYPPELGQHTEELLLELGYSSDDLSYLKQAQII